MDATRPHKGFGSRPPAYEGRARLDPREKKKWALLVGKALPPKRNRREESILDSTQAKLSSLRYGSDSDSEGRGPGMRLCQRMQ